MLSIIVAIAQNNVIGNDNKLIWHLPADLKYFRTVTTGHPIIMGRKTFESIGRPLPGRRNIVISRNSEFSAVGVEVCKSPQDALLLIPEGQNAFIIGGAEIYKQSISLCKRLYLTRVHHSFDGDTFFPEINATEWQLSSSVFNAKDEKNAYDCTFEVYERKG